MYTGAAKTFIHPPSSLKTILRNWYVSSAEILRFFEMANSPKFKYFTDLDDHMMNFDEKLVNEIDLFIRNLN